MFTADIWGKSLFPGITDIMIIMVYLLIIFIFGLWIRNRNVEHNPVYRFYLPGLFAHIAGALAMGLIYSLYYDGGDTTGYYRSSEAMVNLLFTEPLAYLKILFGDESKEALSAFSAETGFPWYRGKSSSFAVVRITSLFTLAGLKNYFTTTILFAWFFYGGFWRLYLFFSKVYPDYYRSFAFAVLFFPSVLFWGSGILKDSIILSAMGWLIYSLFILVSEKRKIIQGLIVVLMASYLIIYIKPYVFVALIPGVFIWYAWSNLRKIDNPVLRFTLTPFTAFAFLGAGMGLLSLFSPWLGEYGSLEGIISKAIITYEDHTRAHQYGENFYTLGHFDGTLLNFISKAPAATIAGLFRPFLWEVKNLVMLLAAVENTFLIILVIVIIWRTGPVKALKILFDEPLVVFSLSFALIFAFAVGISTANFGALVRLKIPLLPFLAAGLFILVSKTRKRYS